MGSRQAAIVAYSPDRRRSRSRSRSRSRRGRCSPSRSRSRSRDRSNIPKLPRSEEGRVAFEKVNAQRSANEMAASRTQAATKAVEAAQKALEAAMAAEVEGANKLQELMKESSRIDSRDRIQHLVDEREDARRSKNFDKSNDLQSELRSLGVQVNDNELTWDGLGGLSGKIKGGLQMRPGDWKCAECGAVVFSSRKVNLKCWKCGAWRPGAEKDNGTRDRGRRSPSYDRRLARRDRGPRRKRSSSSDRGPRRKRSPSY